VDSRRIETFASRTPQLRRGRGRPKISVSKGLRIAIVSTGVLASAVFITVGITGLRNRQIGAETVTSSPTAPARSDSTEIAGKLLEPVEIANGFASVEAGPQGLDELTKRLGEPEAEFERSRLRNAGFLRAAVTIAYKPAVSPPPLTDTAVTVEILEFASVDGAMAQLSHDASGGLVKGFGISEPYEKIEGYAPASLRGSGPPGVLVRKSISATADSETPIAPTPERSRHVVAAAVVRGSWEIVVELRSPNPPPLQELERILALQVSKLGL